MPNQSSNSNFGIGVDRSQLYFKYKALDQLAIDVGQFDTVYGVEVNDSKDRFFGKTGIVYDMLIPVTHTGTMLEYTIGAAYVKVLAVNPSGKGSYGTSTSGDDNTEYGAVLGYTNEHVRGQLGYLSRPIVKADGSGYGNHGLGDATAGVTFGNFSFDAEYVMLSDPSKNTLTPSRNNDLEENGFGILGLATYKLTESLALGLRVEGVENDPGLLNVKSVISETAGVHYLLSPEFELRSEFGTYDFKNVSGAKWNESRFNISTLIKF